MPQRKKRPTALPETVKQRANPKFRSAARVVTATPRTTDQNQGTAPQEVEETRAVLLTDPRDTAPESPTRPERPQPAPMVHTPQPEPEDSVQNPETTQGTLPLESSWYETALEQLPPPPPPPHRGKVALKVSDTGFDVISQGSDVAIHYQRPSQLPPPPPPTDPAEFPRLEPQPPEIAPQLVIFAGGFLLALVLVGIALIGSDRNTIIITPGQTEVIRP